VRKRRADDDCSWGRLEESMHIELVRVLAPPISLDSRLAMEVGSREKGVEDVPEGWVVRSDRRSRRNSTGTVERSGEDGGGVAVIARRGSR